MVYNIFPFHDHDGHNEDDGGTMLMVLVMKMVVVVMSVVGLIGHLDNVFL